MEPIESKPVKRSLRRENTLRARELRSDASVVEQIMRQKLRRKQLGFRFRFQHFVQDVYLDFYCPEARLAVEFDGEQHDPEYDAWRDAKLASLGIETLRIPNREFFLLDTSPDEIAYGG